MKADSRKLRNGNSRKIIFISACLTVAVVSVSCSLYLPSASGETVETVESHKTDSTVLPASYTEPDAEPTVTIAPTSTPSPTPTPEHIVVDLLGDLTLADALAWSGAPGSFDDVVGDDYTYCFQNCAEYLSDDDLTYANFEGVLTDERGGHMDKEFVFASSPESVQILINGSVEAVNLSNNHSFDYWESGYEETKVTLEEAGILWSDRQDTAIFEVRGIKIGMFGLDRIGHGDSSSVGYPLIDELRQAGCQIIIASCHWGVERMYEPNADQIYMAHDLIDHGVDLVVGTHPHRLQPIEFYNGKYILYSLSNFCFGGNTGLSDPDTCIVRCEFVMDETNSHAVEYNLTVIPYSQTSFASNDYCPRPYEWGSDDYYRVLDKLDWNREDE